LLVAGTAAQADTIVYTFAGVSGEAGTDWTLTDPSGYIPDGTNVVSLLTASTDFFSQGTDYGPLIGINDQGEHSGDTPCLNAGTPCFEINMVISLDGGPFQVPFLFAGIDGTTGTFTDLEEGSTLTITDASAPEPGSTTLMLSGVILGSVLVIRKRS
jgi:hypothetical protein